MQDHFDNLPCIYFSIADNNLLTVVNKTLCHYLGYTAEELTGKKVETIFTLSTRIFQQTHLFPLLQMQGHAEEIYITLLTKDGEHLPVLINGKRREVSGSAVIHFAGIVVSKRKKFEEEIIAAKKAAEAALNENTSLTKAKAELQEYAAQLDRQMDQTSRQNKELLQFSRLVTHDLQEPLRKLSFFAGMMADVQDEQKVKATVQKIGRVAGQMRSILHGLQQYVWLTEEVFETELVQLNPLLLAAKTEMEKEYSTAVNLEAAELPPIEANSKQMNFLLQQLLANACRFKRPDIPVTVNVYGSTLRLNKFRQLAGNYNYTEFLKLQVADNGIGFDNQFGLQTFELFRKLHPQSGLGIGLSLCKRIVENHEGTISIESHVDSGTTVTVLLPLKQEKRPLKTDVITTNN